MRSPGSVLIVVLGLLAILAVVGLTFVTMSSIDRRTAANFALQSQFMLAADGAVDYVCHHLVQDLWYYDLKTERYHDRLLTDQNSDGVAPLARNEPFDCPSVDSQGFRYDPWLSTTPDGESIPATGYFSYGNQSGTHYGLTSWGLGTPQNQRPNNLGWPTNQQVRPYTQGNGHGVWIPDLSFPFDVGLIRVSVTVLDHGAMVNLNAHGRNSGSVQECPRYGYVISDVDPQHFGFNVAGLLNGSGQPPGLWSGQDKPYNDQMYEAVIENPGRYGDKPFTLDEEFELRRLIGTHFKSRLEDFGGGNLDSAPDTATAAKARKRLSLTTVSWTSEVRPDYDDPTGNKIEVTSPLPKETPDATLQTTDWSPRKIDLNLDEPAEIAKALTCGCVFPDTDDGRKIRNQFVANIDAFRDGSNDPNKEPITSCDDAGGEFGAAPQPLFSKIQVESEDEEQGGQQFTKWTIKVQIISPWPDSVYGLNGGLRVSNIYLETVKKEDVIDPIQVTPVFPEADTMPADPVSEPWVYTLELTTEKGKNFTTILDKIQLGVDDGPIIDEIDSSVLDDLGMEGDVPVSGTASKWRLIHRAREKRPPQEGGEAPALEESVWVVYIGDWKDEAGDITKFAFANKPLGAIPIWFLRSVGSRLRPHLHEKGLPPYPMQNVVRKGVTGTNHPFRAFARVGDLNQVLCPRLQDIQPAQGNNGDERHFFWPWVTRVVKAAKRIVEQGLDPIDEEKKLKFDWNDPNLPIPGNPSRMNAANVFCVGGPWLDELDNDGDSSVDDIEHDPAPPGWNQDPPPDRGLSPGQVAGEESGVGRFGGPELRVAGKINLSTATDDTLRALAQGVGLPGAGMSADDFVNAVKSRRADTNRNPMYSPVEVFKDHLDAEHQVNQPDATSNLQQRDLAFTRISNIATLRSDTFSIYGTIEYGLIQGDNPPTNTSFKVMRRRRFWALVDRSPCLAYCPGPSGHNPNFIRPRILNFQWLD